MKYLCKPHIIMCFDCTKPIPAYDDYMLHDAVWQALGMPVKSSPGIDFFLHWACAAARAQQRLGRTLTVADLKPNLPINEGPRFWLTWGRP